MCCIIYNIFWSPCLITYSTANLLFPLLYTITLHYITLAEQTLGRITENLQNGFPYCKRNIFKKGELSFAFLKLYFIPSNILF